MIREVCSCGAEFETDDRDAVILIKNWRRTHKHAEKAVEAPVGPFQVQSDSQVALGFQALYDPLNDDSWEDNK
jgi:hypothetical protein